MPIDFNHIALVARPRHQDIQKIRDTAENILSILKTAGTSAFLEKETAQILSLSDTPQIASSDIGARCDLLIVIGGDGSFLHAARMIAGSKTAILGVNRGTLGFLTDIHPDQLSSELLAILQKNYIEEQRFFLDVHLEKNKQAEFHDKAFNDIVLSPGQSTRLIEFSIHVDEDFVCRQRADGLIISTPTGSTAYALSGGGPIVHPALNAIVLVPMFPHTLTNRPIVIDAHRRVRIQITQTHEHPPQVSCDGQAPHSLLEHQDLFIQKSEHALHLIHPKSYRYFDTLRNKLHWGTPLA